MPKALVLEPIRIPNASGTGYVTVGPKYHVDNGRRLKTCPVVEIDANRFQKFKEIGHVQAHKGKAKEVNFLLDASSLKPLHPIEEEEETEEEVEEKQAEPTHDRMADAKQVKKK